MIKINPTRTKKKPRQTERDVLTKANRMPPRDFYESPGVSRHSFQPMVEVVAKCRGERNGRCASVTLPQRAFDIDTAKRESERAPLRPRAQSVAAQKGTFQSER